MTEMTTATPPTIWPIALIASQFTAWSNYDCTCAGFVDAIMANHLAIKNDSRAILRFFEIALVPVRLDHLARFIVNANHSIV
jgi:hypothetical protein